MDVREKLVELLNEVQETGVNEIPADFGYTSEYVNNETVASHLIANGVTVQEWISVTERLPEDRGYYLVAYQDKYNESTSIALDFYVNCGAGEWWSNEFTHNITHWMPLPQPPKGE